MLVIFLMLSVYLYSDQARNYVPQTLHGISQEQVNAIPKEQIIEGPTKEKPTPAASGSATGKSPSFSLTILPRSQVSADFAQQIFTSISTMVISIAAFYFGTRAVASARSAATSSEPVVTSVDPPTAAWGSDLASLKICGSGFDNPSVVKFVKDGRELIIRDITSNPTKIVGTLPDLTSDLIGHWSCIVVNGDGGAAAPLQNAFEVTGPKSPPGSPP
jgi:hypothetical protein